VRRVDSQLDPDANKFAGIRGFESRAPDPVRDSIASKGNAISLQSFWLGVICKTNEGGENVEQTNNV
jgi:hypothetical protein